MGGVIQNCNQNTLGDAFDITSGSSTDCSNNVIPDECEIDTNSVVDCSTTPPPCSEGPFFCTENCDPDCNDNGLLDQCETVIAETHSSGQLSPIGFGSPQSFTILAPPLSRANVVLDFTAFANLGGETDHISVDINGVAVGTVFGPGGGGVADGSKSLGQYTWKSQYVG